MRSLQNTLSGLGAFLLAVQLHAATPGETPTVPPPSAPDNGTEAAPEPGGNSADANPSSAAAAAAANPYQAIVIRNAFGLSNPPPPPPPPQETNPPVNVTALKLTGITTLMGKRAMFSFNDGKTNILSDLVREGERDRSITNLEVLEINEKARTVRVKFGGEDLQLDFVKNGIHPPTNVVMAGITPGMARPALGTTPFTTAQPASGFAPPVLQAGNTAFRAGARSLPVRPTRLGSRGAGIMQGTPGAPQANQPDSVLTPAQQVIVLQEQERLAAQQGIQLPPMPPAPGHIGGQGAPSDGPPALPGVP